MIANELAGSCDIDDLLTTSIGFEFLDHTFFDVVDAGREAAFPEDELTFAVLMLGLMDEEQGLVFRGQIIEDGPAFEVPFIDGE
jgi:hypothetical protein